MGVPEHAAERARPIAMPVRCAPACSVMKMTLVDISPPTERPCAHIRKMGPYKEGRIEEVHPPEIRTRVSATKEVRGSSYNGGYSEFDFLYNTRARVPMCGWGK